MTSALIKKLKPYLPSIVKNNESNLGSLAYSLSELPIFAARAASKHFKGNEGKSNLVKGMMVGSGLTGLAAGADYASDGNFDNNKGTALAGISGLLSPFLLRGGRAGFSEAKSLFDIIKRTHHKGLRTYSEADMAAKQRVINNLINNPLESFKGILGSSTARADIASLLRPSKGVSIGMLTNRYGNMNDILPSLKTLSTRFGKTELGTGTIINPNIAAMYESGILGKILSRNGFTRLHGGATGKTSEIGDELAGVLSARLNKLIRPRSPSSDLNPATLSEKARSKYLPDTRNNVFPLSFKTKDGVNIRIPRGRKAISDRDFNMSVDEEMRLPILDYAKMSPSVKKWLMSQNVNSREEYNNLINLAKGYQSDALIAASENPNVFIKEYTGQRLKNFFKDSNPYSFDEQLSRTPQG